MRHLASTQSFQKQIHKLSSDRQHKVAESLKKLRVSLERGKFPQGLGFKKINGDKYEIRIDIHLRIVLKKDGDFLVCALAGNHDEIRQYLKNFRNK